MGLICIVICNSIYTILVLRLAIILFSVVCSLIGAIRTVHWQEDLLLRYLLLVLGVTDIQHFAVFLVKMWLWCVVATGGLLLAFCSRLALQRLGRRRPFMWLGGCI